MRKKIVYISLLIIVLFVGCNKNNSINEKTEKSNGNFVYEDEPKDTEHVVSLPPNEDFGKVEHFIEKPEYSIDKNNYASGHNHQKYLLWIELDPIWAEGKNLYVGDYFIDVQETNTLNTYYEITSNSLIPEALKVDSGMIRKFSEDGKKVLLSYWINEEKTNVIEVFNFVNSEVLYHYESKETFKVSSNSNLNHLIIHNYESDFDYYIDINKKDKGMLKIPKYPLNTVISEDGTKLATIDLVMADNVKIKIHDIVSGELIDEIPFGDERPDLRQWHKDGKLVYSTYEGSFIYDISKKETELVGEYFYEPLLSPDGQYITFVRHEEADYYFPLYENNHSLYQKCGYKEGLYVKNLSNGEITQVAPYYRYETQIYKQSPVQWIYVNGDFDNNKYRCFQEQEQEKYIDVAVSSSFLDRFFAENVLDGDTSTAWVEAEEKYIQEKENDGKGIGEWIKLYRVEHSLKYGLNYSKSFIISGIRLINGYAKSEDTYKANNRVKKVEVILTDGSSYIFDLKDNILDFQTLNFGKEVETRDVTIKILDIYEGTKYNDTCISEVQLIEAE